MHYRIYLSIPLSLPPFFPPSYSPVPLFKSRPISKTLFNAKCRTRLNGFHVCCSNNFCIFTRKFFILCITRHYSSAIAIAAHLRACRFVVARNLNANVYMSCCAHAYTRVSRQIVYIYWQSFSRCWSLWKIIDSLNHIVFSNFSITIPYLRVVQCFRAKCETHYELHKLDVWQRLNKDE